MRAPLFMTTSTVAARIPYANAAPFYALWADAPFSVRNLVPRHSLENYGRMQDVWLDR